MIHRSSILVLVIILSACSLPLPVAAAGQPAADFTVKDSYNQGFAPFTADFQDRSARAASWSWNFGDGQTSSEQNPSHTFASPGIYTVTLTVYDASGTLISVKTVPDCIIVAADPMHPGTGTTTSTTQSSPGVTATTTAAQTTTAPLYSGTIAITSEPAGAMVSIDGIQQGITPVTLYTVPAGRHRILIHLKGFPDNETTVTVVHEQTVSLAVDLTKEGATRPTTRPPTRVTTDTPLSTPSAAAAETAAEGSSRAAGIGRTRNTTLTVYCSDCLKLTCSRSGEAKPITSIWYEVALKDKSTPYFASDMVIDTLVLPDMPPGDYRVTVKPDCYYSSQKSATMKAGEATRVTFNGSGFSHTPGFTWLVPVIVLAGIALLRRIR